MRFWNYIGEFFLFRWLFGKFSKSKNTQEDNCANTIIDSVDIDEAANTTVPTEAPNSHKELDSSEKVGELDDLDIFMSTNQSKKNNNSDYVFNRRSYVDSGSRYNWNDNYNQSFTDFHEEQDDYDMMDDF